MSIKSISGLVFHVKNLNAAKGFYEKLGFKFASNTEGYLKAYINWFWVEFYEGEADKGAQAYTQLSVGDVDEFYKELVSKGMKPDGEPKDIPAGRREFLLTDPDGYKLIFFTKK
jgi:catechol 2,3-dioxygenase-like lactoylglutathione lyase family enzyme